MKNVLLYLGMGTFFTHELDAMINYEWRIIPLLRSLPEQAGMNTFILLHIPFFAVLISLVASNDKRVRRISRLTLSIFLLLHAGLHVWFSNEANYAFASNLSNALIFGSTMFGGLYLASSFAGNRK